MDKKQLETVKCRGPCIGLSGKSFLNTPVCQASARGSKAHSSLLPLGVRAAEDSQTPACPLSLPPSFRGGEMAQTAQ